MSEPDFWSVNYTDKKTTEIGLLVICYFLLFSLRFAGSSVLRLTLQE